MPLFIYYSHRLNISIRAEALSNALIYMFRIHIMEQYLYLLLKFSYIIIPVSSINEGIEKM